MSPEIRCIYDVIYSTMRRREAMGFSYKPGAMSRVMARFEDAAPVRRAHIIDVLTESLQIEEVVPHHAP